MRDYTKDLGNRIQTLRKQRGLTQAELAEIVSKSTNHIAKIEIGGASPSLSLIFDISTALNITPDELFKFSNDTKNTDIINIGNVTNVGHKHIIRSVLNILIDELAKL